MSAILACGDHMAQESSLSKEELIAALREFAYLLASDGRQRDAIEILEGIGRWFSPHYATEDEIELARTRVALGELLGEAGRYPQALDVLSEL